MSPSKAGTLGQHSSHPGKRRLRQGCLRYLCLSHPGPEPPEQSKGRTPAKTAPAAQLPQAGLSSQCPNPGPEPLGCWRDAIFLLFNPILPSAGQALKTRAAGSFLITASQVMRPQHLLLFLALDVTTERCKRDMGRGRQSACCTPLQLRLETGGSSWQRHCRGVAHPLWDWGFLKAVSRRI